MEKIHNCKEHTKELKISIPHPNPSFGGYNPNRKVGTDPTTFYCEICGKVFVKIIEVDSKQ